MPAVDLPLEELLEYQGETPKPDDFDAYWEAALAEMRTVAPEVTVKPSNIRLGGAECMDFTFTGVRGARIYAKYLRPVGIAGPTPAVIMFHGYSGHSGEWYDKMAYVAAGYSVFAMDCRGQAGLSQDVGGVTGTTFRGHIIRGLDDAPENLLFRQVFLDAAQLAGIVLGMEGIDPQRVYVMGGSQGGGLATVCAALEPRIRRAAILWPFLSDYRRVWQLDMVKHAYEELAYYFRRIDPLHQREDEVFRRLGYLDAQNFAGRVKAEVLFAATLQDMVCPPSTQFAVYNKLPSQKELLVYPDYGHELPPGCMDRVVQFLTQASPN